MVLLKVPPRQGFRFGKNKYRKNHCERVRTCDRGGPSRGEFCRVFRLSRVSPTGDPLRNLFERTSGTRKLSTSSPSSFYSLMRVLFPRRPLGNTPGGWCVQKLSACQLPLGICRTVTAQLQWLGVEPGGCWRRKGWLMRVQPGKLRPRKNNCSDQKPQQHLVMELSQRRSALQRSNSWEAALDDTPFAVSFL